MSGLYGAGERCASGSYGGRENLVGPVKDGEGVFDQAAPHHRALRGARRAADPERGARGARCQVPRVFEKEVDRIWGRVQHAEQAARRGLPAQRDPHGCETPRHHPPLRVTQRLLPPCACRPPGRLRRGARRRRPARAVRARGGRLRHELAGQRRERRERAPLEQVGQRDTHVDGHGHVEPGRAVGVV